MIETHKLPCAISSGGTRRVGVIDVGSNSVRLVVYQSGKRVPVVVFNEKVLCGLGRKLSSTGRLDPEGVDLAILSAKRFTVLAREMGIERMDMVATAAVRHAKDGPDFVKRVSDYCKQDLRVLSGSEEARLAAYGIFAGIPDAKGLAGDLGGGSLELVSMSGGGLGDSATLPLGPLQLLDIVGGDADAAAEIIAARLAEQSWITDFKGENFYAVGGTWRALAKLHMTQTEYPLRILHYYRVGGKEMRRFAQSISAQDRDSLKLFRRVPKKRLDTLPFAALVLARVLETLRPKSVVFSALGLREGLIFNQMPADVRKLDPLIEECRAWASEQGRFAEHGDELFDWIGPLFRQETEQEKRLRLAACLLSDIGWRGHPDYRADLTLDQILEGQFVGLDHPGRALIALALFVCYGGSLDGNGGGADRARRLLDDDQISAATRIGMSLRLGQRISGGTEGLLRRCRLDRANGELLLMVSRGSEHLVGQVAARRLKSLGDVLGLVTRVAVADSAALPHPAIK